jgi:hypothetical protein
LFGSAELLTLDDARRIAVNIAKLPRHRLERAISTRITSMPCVHVLAITKNTNLIPQSRSQPILTCI